MKPTQLLTWPTLALAGAFAACVQHRVDVEPIEIEPIRITMDINLNVKRELDEFFDFEKQPTATPEPDKNKSGGGR
jgi:hypothetical protein